MFSPDLRVLVRLNVSFPFLVFALTIFAYPLRVLVRSISPFP